MVEKLFSNIFGPWKFGGNNKLSSSLCINEIHLRAVFLFHLLEENGMINCDRIGCKRKSIGTLSTIFDFFFSFNI